ncbi:MAG: hypothetical protein E3J21_04720 [Anaerolineales bacterium]|nr:MAG: hypothetical protein E3J21_04720 [Anaerolineales bacterium]
MLPKIADVISDLLAELIVAIVLIIGGWLLRDFLKQLWYKVIDWLARQWRYLVIVILMILIEIALYLVYASWWIIAFSIAHLALVMLAILLLFAPKQRPGDIERHPPRKPRSLSKFKRE